MGIFLLHLSLTVRLLVILVLGKIFHEIGVILCVIAVVLSKPEMMSEVEMERTEGLGMVGQGGGWGMLSVRERQWV
jgi:hypothetical protein